MFPSKKAVLSMTNAFNYNSIILNPQRDHKKVLKNYRLNRRLAFISSKKSNLSIFPAEKQKITFFSELKELFSMSINFFLGKLRKFF